MTELQTWELLKQKAITTKLDFAIFYYKEGQIHLVPCSSNSDIQEQKVKYQLYHGIPQLIIHIDNGQKNLSYNGIELMAVDILENNHIKNVYYNSDFLRKKQPKATMAELVKSVKELEGALKSSIQNTDETSLSPRILN